MEFAKFCEAAAKFRRSGYILKSKEFEISSQAVNLKGGGFTACFLINRFEYALEFIWSCGKIFKRLNLLLSLARTRFAKFRRDRATKQYHKGREPALDRKIRHRHQAVRDGAASG